MGEQSSKQQTPQQKTPQTQQKPTTTLVAKEVTNQAGTGAVELKPVEQVMVSTDFNRVIIYSESIKAESSFTGNKKSVMTLKQSREISITVEPDVE